MAEMCILGFSHNFANELRKILEDCNFSKIIPVASSREDDVAQQHERCEKSRNKTGRFPGFRPRVALALRSFHAPRGGFEFSGSRALAGAKSYDDSLF